MSQEVSQQDRTIIRELAKQYHDCAQMEENAERRRRITQMHSLVPGRPPVWIAEIPWHEMDIDGQLVLRCQHPRLRAAEERFRQALFAWKYFRADMVLQDVYPVAKAFDDTGNGAQVREQTTAKDAANHIISHHYEDELGTQEKLDALHSPVLTARPEEDAENLAFYSELLGDILPVRLRGHSVYHAPWDVIIRLRGVEPVLMDVVDRAEFLHAIIERFTQFGIDRYTQMEAQGLLDVEMDSLHCTPHFTNDLPAEGFDPNHVRRKDVWFRGMAQMFASISPAMHDELDIQYMLRLTEHFGLSYYGCCEPLERMIPYLKKITNLRKIGVSPWADVRSCAEQIGGKYVVARKPNPAHVAGSFDAETVEREIRETVEVCQENGCAYEFVLKDISTVGYKPQNLIDWTNTVTRVLDEYYK